MESGEVKAEQRQQPVTPMKRRRPKPEKSAQANGGSSSSAAESSPLSSGKRPRLVWTDELHDLFVEAYDSLGDGMVAYCHMHLLVLLI
jgi:hypothetical protein